MRIRWPKPISLALIKASTRGLRTASACASLLASAALGATAPSGNSSTCEAVKTADPCDSISIGVLDIALLSMRDRATKGDCNARCDAAIQLLSGELGFLDKSLAHSVLSELSESRCPRAMLFWGRILLEGAGTPTNSDEAIRLLKSAGENGEAAAWCVLERAYARGEGLPKDEKLAAEYAEKAVQANFAPAVMDQAVMSLATSKEPEKVAVATATIRRLAENGYSRAQAALARFYIMGENGFPKDTQLAGTWGERAAVQGEPLGFGPYAARLMDEHRPGTEGFRRAVMFIWLGAEAKDRVTLNWWKDLTRSLPASEIEAAQDLADRWTPTPGEASKWWYWCISFPPTGELPFAERQELDRLEHLANAGDPAAAASLAEEYFHGLGRTKNRAKAGELLLIAARAGNPISQRGLGRMYLAGCGFEKAPRQAAYWFQVAANQGLKNPKGLEEAEGSLSDSERKLVAEEAKAFVPVLVRRP